MIHSTYPTFDRNSLPRHENNVGAQRPMIRHNTSKSQAAAILGSSTSEAKASAAQKNGQKGGRPVGS